MRSFPDSTRSKARLALLSLPDFADSSHRLRRTLRANPPSHRGRHFAGALVAFSAMAIFQFDGTAHAASTKAVTTSSKRAAVAPTPTPSRTPVDAVITYTIKNGDTLSGIAAKNGLSVPALATVNGINNHNKIVAGRQLLIPVTATNATAAKATAAKVTTKSVALPAKVAQVSVKPSPGQALPQDLLNNPARARLLPHFKQAAQAYGVPLELLQSMAWQESGWQNQVVSNTGAVGVGQLMPATVDFVNEVLLTKPLDPNVPEQNVRMSAAFLRYLLDQTNGDHKLALASYYQGLGSVRRIGLYDDTQQYVQSVLAVQARWF